MNIVVLSGSPRKGGNTDLLVQAFVDGAKENNQVEVVCVRDFQVNPCIGCNSCFNRPNGDCFQADDMQKIYPILACADMLVVASPVYFYGISAQLKAVIDRLHTPKRNSFKVKKTALLLTAASSKDSVFDAIKQQYELILKYFDFQDVCQVFVGGVKDKGDIADREEIEKVYLLAKSLE
ncbi:MAG: flavodoxin family protein [Clostridia bacterium]|nr:flavodoxin family protein [Clostridia bacterium]MDE7328801.1 flavodoxin family protein [Clostridia bacterium]